MDKGDLRKTVDHLWSFLDDLAETDPASYKNFVANQLKEGPGKLPDPNKTNSENQKKPDSKPIPSIVLPFKSALTDNPGLSDDTIGNEDDIQLHIKPEGNDNPQRKVWIEEVKETPEHSLMKTDSGVEIHINLPLLETIEDVAVDISPKEIVLDCSLYYLRVEFPHVIASQTYKAKWLKRGRKLVISQ